MEKEQLYLPGPETDFLTEQGEDWQQCALCGFRYREGRHSLCTSCPLNHGCSITCCPNCGYENPPESKIVRWLKNWPRRRRR